jgi:hypothetical protein
MSTFALTLELLVTIHSAVRNDGGVQPGLGKYLRVCVTFCEDFILSVEVRSQIPLADTSNGIY